MPEKNGKGTKAHGIVAVLSVRPCNTAELSALFPGLEGSSLLTYMRRDGLILKGEDKNWQVTVAGKALLAKHGEYTLDMYKRSSYLTVDATFLPWTRPFKAVRYHGASDSKWTLQ